MKILATRISEGPNIHSMQAVLCIKLSLGEHKDIPTNKLDGFNHRLLTLLPSLYSHQCSLGYQGGFVQRLSEGTYLAHVFEHVALELQCLAGYQVGFGKTRYSGLDDIYNIIIGYRRKQAAIKAVEQTQLLLTQIIKDRPVDVADCVQSIKVAGQQEALGPSTQALFEAAKQKNIPITRIDDESLLILGQGIKQKRLWATISEHTGALACDIACDKNLTKQLLYRIGIPVPDGKVVVTKEEAVEALLNAGIPVAVKPLCGNQGKGVTLKVADKMAMERAFDQAREFDQKIIVEEYIPGKQYRLCIVNGKMVAVAERIPAHIIGDGINSVKTIIDRENTNPLRGDGHGRPLTKLVVDSIALVVLAQQGLSLETVPALGRLVYLRDSANISTGGTAVDVTDDVHPDYVQMALRATRQIGLDIAGVDIVAKDIRKPYLPSHNNAAVIEINAAPGIRMHHYPTVGTSRNVAKEIIEYLFPNGQNGRIPVTAITGTNGKTTVARMVGHIWQLTGKKVGMTTTEGIFINDECILPGDTTGPASARVILGDATVEVAVLETARGGILRSGLAFDACDVGVITNITEDHLGQDGIEDLQDMAFIKSLVIETVKPDGYAVLNADDPLVAQLASRVRSQIIYFSTERDNIIVKRHLGAGGRALFVKNKVIYSACGGLAKPIVKVADIPVTLGGIAKHNIQNSIIAAAAAICQDLPIDVIRQGLKSFQDNPGRLNIIDMGDFRVCVDYGHNPAGYAALIQTVSKLRAKRLVGVIAAPGDRRNDVIINIGRVAGCGFQKIYIKEDSDLRGRNSGEVANLLLEGVNATHTRKQGVEIILDEAEAVKTAIQKAKPGDFIVVFYEKYHNVMETVTIQQDIAKKSPAVSNQFLVAPTYVM